MNKWFLLLFAVVLSNVVNAQEQKFRLVTRDEKTGKVSGYTDTIHNSKVYIVSGSLGFGFPMGKTKDILNTRLASSWGMDISLPNRHYVLYPSIDFWSFGYNQKNLTEKSAYLVENGRATFYNVNIALGTRRQFNKLNSYVTAGPSIGMFFEPRATLERNNVIRNDFDSKLMFGARASAGADYKFNGFFVYVDASWMHSFGKVQETPINILSFYVGLKTDITNVADKVVTVFDRKKDN